jgi:hypothetical protein
MKGREAEYGLEFLLAFDGRVHHLEEGYWLKFEVRRVEATKERPHGLSYSFTLHAPDGSRLVGFEVRQRAWRSSQGFSVQGSARGERSLASDRERSRPALRLQRCRDLD